MQRRLRIGLSALSCFILLAACRAQPEPEPEPVAVASSDEIVDPEAIDLGLWADYPSPEDEEWAVEPLSVVRWATASAELACAGRAFSGDPGRQRSASERILNHHSTTAADVMAYGIDLNGQAERAQRLGGLVAEAAERCR